MEFQSKRGYSVKNKQYLLSECKLKQANAKLFKLLKRTSSIVKLKLVNRSKGRNIFFRKRPLIREVANSLYGSVCLFLGSRRFSPKKQNGIIVPEERSFVYGIKKLPSAN